MMSTNQTNQTVFYEGVRAYEAGKIHEALNRWKQVLNLSPNHHAAQRYVRFVENYFNLTPNASETEVSQAAFKLGVGAATPMPSAENSNLNVAEKNSFQYSRQPLGDVSVEVNAPSTLSVMPDSMQSVSQLVPQKLLSDIQELRAQFEERQQAQNTPIQSVVTPVATPVTPNAGIPMPPLSTPMTPVQTSVSTPLPSMTNLNPIAQQAISGPEGPKTQADGLTVQALSKKIAELHRSGKYEQAVDVARDLLKIDPNHLVAQRYITEYQRQKQLALDQQRKKQNPQNTYQKVEFQSAQPQEIPDDSPTATPPAVKPELDVLSRASAAAVSSAKSLTMPPIDLNKAPKILLAPELISWQELDHRAGYFLSQVDGTTSYEDLIEISGMPKAEAIAILTKLLEKGIIGTR